MSVSSTTVLRCELKPLEAPFLPADDPHFLWLTYQIFVYFEDCLKAIGVRQEYMKSQRKKKCLYNHKSVKGIKIKYILS